MLYKNEHPMTQAQLHVGDPRILIFFAAALMSACLIVLLHPVLLRYALAHPNIRSSHHTPTPQGTVIAATIISVFGASFFLLDPIGKPLQLAIVLACAAGLAVGAKA